MKEHDLSVSLSNSENATFCVSFSWGEVLTIVQCPSMGIAMQASEYLQAIWQGATWKVEAAEAFFKASVQRVHAQLSEGKQPLNESVEIAILCKREGKLFVYCSSNFLIYIRKQKRFELEPAVAIEAKRSGHYFNSTNLDKPMAFFIATANSYLLFKEHSPDSVWEQVNEVGFVQTMDNMARQKGLKAGFGLMLLNQKKTPASKSSVAAAPVAAAPDAAAPVAAAPDAAAPDAAKKMKYSYPVFLMIALLLTFLHLRSYWHPLPDTFFSNERIVAGVPLEEDSAGASTLFLSYDLKELETFSDFDWNKELCPKTPVESFKAMLDPLREGVSQNAQLKNIDERELGDILLNRYRKESGVSMNLNDHELNYISGLLQSIAFQIDIEIGEIDAYVSESLEKNAFMLPGGIMVIERGLLQSLIMNEAQLVFVLAHEIAHYKLEHHKEYFEALGRSDYNADMMDSVLFTGYHSVFGVTQEEEADMMAFDVTLEMGYSPLQGLVLFEGIQRAEVEANKSQINSVVGILEGFNQVMNTHPELSRRICYLKNKVIDHKDILMKEPTYIGQHNYKIKKTAFEETF